MRALKAELSKLFSLPTIWLTILIGALVPPLISGLDSAVEKEDIIAGVSTRISEIGYIGLQLGVLGAIILGVLVMSSEYASESSESGGGKQITTSLTAVSSRMHVILAKVGSVAILSMLLSIVAIITSMTVTRVILGEYAPAIDSARLVGASIYWVLTSLLAFGITVFTKNGVIPLSVLILNSSVVTVTYLLTQVTDWAYYFPDMAGSYMFIAGFSERTSHDILTPLTGGLIMFAWVALILSLSIIVFKSTDVVS